MADKRLPSRVPDEPTPSEADQSFLTGAAPRFRVADRVFDALLGAILRGELAPGEPVPTQRALSREFGVSPLVVRHAIHRLEELELVRVRQGSPTIVLDPNRATDVRLIQLQLEAATPGDALALAGLENRALSTLPLLILAARRITDDELTELDALVEGLGDDPTSEQLEAFQSLYWDRVAKATRNPLLQHQVRWWFHTVRGLRAAASMAQIQVQTFTYRQLNRSMRERNGALEVWLDMLRQLFEWTETQPGHALLQAPPVSERARERPRFSKARD